MSQSRKAIGRVGALAQRVELLDGGGAAVVSLPQSSDQVPDRVAVQDLPLLRVRLGGQGLVDEPLDADHVFIALRQGTDADEDLAQVSERRSVGAVRRAPRGSSARRPAARSARTGATGFFFSHRMAVMGCSAVAMLCRSASSPG